MSGSTSTAAAPPSSGQPGAAKSGAVYGPRFEAALAYACSLHFEQRRKGSGAPYIVHPMAVASLVGEYGGDEDVAIAALLHDTIEDCGVTEAQLADRYGVRVARIVRACSDTTVQPKPPWEERKAAHLAKLRTADADVKLVVAADKLHNCRSILADLQRASVGAVVWTRFRPKKNRVIWYYESAVEALEQGWTDELLDELRRYVAQLAVHRDPGDTTE